MDSNFRQALHDKILSSARRFIAVDRSYDIPYLGGYSQDGRTVYLDRRLPIHMTIDGRLINVGSLICIHERVEKSLITRMHYAPAHAIATFFEHEAVIHLGLSPQSYESALRPYIRACAHETVTRIPPDLDLTPYEDEHDRTTLRKLGAV